MKEKDKDEDNKKTINFTFRLSPKDKQRLAFIAEEYGMTASAFFNLTITDHLKRVVIIKALRDGRDFAAKEFGLSENIRDAIKNLKDIKCLFPNEDDEVKFLACWIRATNVFLDEYNASFDVSRYDESDLVYQKLLTNDLLDSRLLDEITSELHSIMFKREEENVDEQKTGG
jgi:predicted transcriptional regulator